jgi:hypothetical protein
LRDIAGHFAPALLRVAYFSLNILGGDSAVEFSSAYKRVRGASEREDRRPVMRASVFTIVSGTLAIVLGASVLGQTISAPRNNQDDDQTGDHGGGGPRAPAYNPYPRGILPPDLDSEIARVRREIKFIFQQAVAEWHALPPPNLTGQPPTLQGSGYRMVTTLGKLMNFDENISVFKNTACAFCHMPYTGFSGPIPSVNLTIPCRQANRAAIHVFTQIPRIAALPDPRPALWRKLLGWTLDWILAAKCRRRAGAASSRRHARNGCA